MNFFPVLSQSSLPSTFVSHSFILLHLQFERQSRFFPTKSIVGILSFPWVLMRNANPQKQSSADVLQNRCYLKFRKFHGKGSVLESLFNNVATLLKRYSNTGVFLWNLRNFWKHLFLQNTSGQPPECLKKLPGKYFLDKHWKSFNDVSSIQRYKKIMI